MERADYRNQMGSPKTKAGVRDVPLSPMVINTLRQWRLACPQSELGIVFTTKNGTLFIYSQIAKMGILTSAITPT